MKKNANKKKILKLIVAGAKGRMGREVITLIGEDPSLELFAAINSENDWRLLRCETEFPKGKFEEKAVVIDFSTVEGFNQALGNALKNKLPLVSGTTGLDKNLLLAIKAGAKKIPILVAPNMAELIYVKAQVLKVLAKYSHSSDFQIEEFHHIKKVDSPSGTAKMLQSVLAESLGRKMPNVLAGRGGGIFGVHKTWVMTPDETLTVEHTALNRTVFARGAVNAAKWIVGQPPGLYSFTDYMESKAQL